MGTVVTKKDPIYISSDSDSEDITWSAAVSTRHSVIDISNSAQIQTAKRHCADVNPGLVNISGFFQPRYRPPEPCFTTALSSNLPTCPQYTPPVPLHFCEGPPQGLTASISDQPSLYSSCWQIVKTHQRMYVVCPVCKIQVRSGSVLGHIKQYHQQTPEWNQSRPCQLCVEQGENFTRVTPEHLWFHILYQHKANGHLPGLALDPEWAEWKSWIKRDQLKRKTSTRV